VRSQGETARLEFGAGDLNRVLQRLSQEAAWENGLADRPEDGDPSFRQALVQRFLALGFTAVALDLEGLVSGKLNRNLRAAPDLDGAAIPGPAA
jgi:pyridinium-3,5-biscarboxylic acid mononucleotide sulfurtransferase